MRKLMMTVGLSAVCAFAAMALYACHAEDDDPAGQAGELQDPVRRQNAVTNIHRLYTTALANHTGDRNHPAVKAIADVTVEQLAQTYIDHPEDTQNGSSIINLFSEMRDRRSIPALLKALNWRSEVTEEHAIAASRTLKVMDLPDDTKAQVITGLSDALDKITGARAVDNRMRIEFIRALGAIGDRRATPILTKIALAQREEQNFLINRLAATSLGELGDPEAVQPMIECLFLFAPGNPAMRMNDVAAESLVRIGRPALEPLLQVLRGQNAEVNAIAQQYIEAVRVRDERAARDMNVRALTSAEATFALGALGFREALAPIQEEMANEDVGRKINAAIAIVRLNLEPAERVRVRDSLKAVYEAAPLAAKAQLLAAMRHMYDADLLPFFLEQARDSDLHPQVREQAVIAYAFLSNRAESAALRTMIQAEPASEDGGFRENFALNDPSLSAAQECDTNIQCWIGKLSDADNMVVKKASYMLGRYGRANDEAITALVEKLDHDDLEVRLAVVGALDFIAVAGSQAALDKIERLRETEEGRSIWTNFAREALPVQARLRTRMQG